MFRNTWFFGPPRPPFWALFVSLDISLLKVTLVQLLIKLETWGPARTQTGCLSTAMALNFRKGTR